MVELYELGDSGSQPLVWSSEPLISSQSKNNSEDSYSMSERRRTHYLSFYLAKNGIIGMVKMCWAKLLFLLFLLFVSIS